MAAASEAQVVALTSAYKAEQNRDAAKIAALIALAYRRRVNPEDPAIVEQWLAAAIPNLIKASDDGANRASAFYAAARQLEGIKDRFSAAPTLGSIDPGVRKSLLTVGPFDYMNKARVIETLDVSPTQKQALLKKAMETTADKVAAAAMRHAQAGSRDTIIDNTQRDTVALGWVRVTGPTPCAFCAMLASRGITYRSFKEGSFDASDVRFTGKGDAKVHDSCGCGLKPVYTKNDPLLAKISDYADQWSMWGAGGGDAALRFRRGYDHLQKTGKYLTWDEANKGLRAA